MPNYKNKTVGEIAANGESVTHPLRSLQQGQIAIQVAGTFVGTLEIEASLDGTNFVGYAVKDSVQTTATTYILQITAPKLLVADAFGLESVRVRASAWTSGSCIVTIVNV
jgi:hypothetical protein